MRSQEPSIWFESHAQAATLYVSGPMTAGSALSAVRACDDLPHAVQSLRVDLRGAEPADAGALETFALALGEWRAMRGARTRLALPWPRRGAGVIHER